MRVIAGYHSIPDEVQKRTVGRYDAFLVESKKTMVKENLRCLVIEPDNGMSVRSQVTSLNRAIKRLGLDLKAGCKGQRIVLYDVVR